MKLQQKQAHGPNAQSYFMKRNITNNQDVWNALYPVILLKLSKWVQSTALYGSDHTSFKAK